MATVITNIDGDLENKLIKGLYKTFKKNIDKTMEHVQRLTPELTGDLVSSLNAKDESSDYNIQFRISVGLTKDITYSEYVHYGGNDKRWTKPGSRDLFIDIPIEQFNSVINKDIYNTFIKIFNSN